MAMLRLAPPWITYVSELEQLFKYDPQVHVVYDNETSEVRLYVDDGPKAEALQQLLPTTQEYGNVTLKVTVVPANKTEVANINDNEELFYSAFKGNPVCSFIKTVRNIFSNNLVYVVFAKHVVQYYNDNLGDIYGQCSTLYQEIAKNVFVHKDGVYFCTDAVEPVAVQSSKLDEPLGEWP